MRKLTLALSGAVLALSGAALAQNAAAPAAEKAAKPDLTRAEAQAKAEAAFARLDANRDGTLNEADRAARRAQMFDRIDTNRDGSISRAEFDAMHAGHGEHGKSHGERMGRKGPGGGHHAMMGGAMGMRDLPATREAFVARALERFDRADANRDGTLTQAERKAARESMRQQWQARRQQG